MLTVGSWHYVKQKTRALFQGAYPTANLPVSLFSEVERVFCWKYFTVTHTHTHTHTHTQKKKHLYKHSVFEPRCLKILNPFKALCLQQAGEPRYRSASYHLMMQSCGLRIRPWNVAPERRQEVRDLQWHPVTRLSKLESRKASKIPTSILASIQGSFLEYVRILRSSACYISSFATFTFHE